MRKVVGAAAILLASAVPSFAQQMVSPPPQPIVRSPSSSGASSGTSGAIGSPTPMYPARVPNYTNPAASYPRLPATGAIGVRR